MPGHSHSHFAESFEMYMKAIYRLEREGPGVTTSALATELGVAPASVSGMLKKLVSEGFVEHEVRGDIRLTTKGLEVAVGVVRRNRLAERLLTDVLGMPWDEVYAEACILEHAITDRVEERLVVALGDPKTCPHGHPIPAKDLTEPVRDGNSARPGRGGHARDGFGRHRTDAGDLALFRSGRIASGCAPRSRREGAARGAGHDRRRRRAPRHLPRARAHGDDLRDHSLFDRLQRHRIRLGDLGRWTEHDLRFRKRQRDRAGALRRRLDPGVRSERRTVVAHPHGRVPCTAASFTSA